MPQLSDLLEKKKFIKKSYRPWDLSGNGTIDSLPSSDNTSVLSPSNLEPPSTITKEAEQKEPTKVSSSILLAGTSDNKTGNNKTTIKEQIDNIRATVTKQPGNNQVTSSKQLSNNSDNVTGNIADVYYLTEAIKKLTGIQKNIFLYIINTCSARGSLETGNLLSSDLANAANCSIGSAKTSLNRLIDKYLVLRHEGKACRGGHMVLGITHEIQAAAIQAQQALFNPLKASQTDNIIGNNLSNNSPYSSSIYNKNITTMLLPDEWKKINFEVLQKIGFSETQLRQLWESKTSNPEIVQSSINHFAYALEHKEKVKAYQDPLNVLMGVLRKGQNWHETDYVSPQEQSLQRVLEEKRKRKEKIDAMIKELIDLEFPDWRKKLTESEIKSIVPESIMKLNVSSAISASLRTYFVENILLPKLEIAGAPKLD